MEEDNLFRPIDVDSNVLGDDVAKMLFDEDKKDFTLLVNISDEITEERSTKEIDDFILENVLCNTDKTVPQQMVVDQEEPLDLRVFPKEKQAVEKVTMKNIDTTGAEPQAKSNQVCFLISEIFFIFFKNISDNRIIIFLFIERKYTFQEKKRKIASIYKPSW